MMETYKIPLLKNHHSHPSVFAALKYGLDISGIGDKDAAIARLSEQARPFNLILGWNNRFFPLDAGELDHLPAMLVCNVSFHEFLLNRSARDKYVQDFSDKVDGIVIWAAYPSELYRIDDKKIKAICIYGTRNPNCNADEIEENKPFLPQDTVFVEIEGGNHTQFGYYDTSPDPVQPGDGIATITRQEQQDIIIRSTVDFLEQL